MAVEHAGWGFATFAIAMSLMRFIGDRVVKVLGRKRVLMSGGILGIAGYLIVVLLPGWGSSCSALPWSVSVLPTLSLS
ncbi:hypothetical protein ERHA55_51990 (plasmid) [Erwinia rhapontici]|nr:hypothetical protein [Erwinia rhapontici]BCQ47672.1 hypothetical protein ERHA55_51990 [Erwinia rhapontici]